MSSKRRPSKSTPKTEQPSKDATESAGAAVESPPSTEGGNVDDIADTQVSGGIPAVETVTDASDVPTSETTPAPSDDDATAGQVSGGIPVAALAEQSKDTGAVIQRRRAAVERWVEKQGWGPTETRKLVESVPDLVDKGWLWQCNDGTREFVPADIPADAASFADALEQVTMVKGQHQWFLWNARLRDV